MNTDLHTLYHGVLHEGLEPGMIPTQVWLGGTHFIERLASFIEAPDNSVPALPMLAATIYHLSTGFYFTRSFFEQTRPISGALGKLYTPCLRRLVLVDFPLGTGIQNKW